MPSERSGAGPACLCLIDTATGQRRAVVIDTTPEALWEWLAQLRQQHPQAYYVQQRTKGAPHHTAVRALAFKWQRIIWRCWQNRQPYQAAVYEAALRQHKSPLVALFDRVELGKSPFKNPAKKV